MHCRICGVTLISTPERDWGYCYIHEYRTIPLPAELDDYHDRLKRDQAYVVTAIVLQTKALQDLHAQAILIDAALKAVPTLEKPHDRIIPVTFGS